MEIAIFKELTTNEQLDKLKVESEKYTGLYVDMENAKERKYVKEKADDINQLLKKVERLRIDASKEYKIKVEAEAADITERLEIANLPFTLLIDEYKEERKKILDAEKAKKEAVELAVKIEGDHEFALLMNIQFDNDKATAERERVEYEEKLKTEAAAQAKLLAEQAAKEAQEKAENEKQAAIYREEQAIIATKKAEEKAKEDAITAKNNAILAAEQAEKKRLNDIEQAKQAEIFRQKEEKRIIDEETAKREANKKYLAKVHNGILKVLLDNGLSEKDSKTVIKLAAKNELPQLTINY